MSQRGGEARGLTLTERGEISQIIIRWRSAADGCYDPHFLKALMGLVRATGEILDLAVFENQREKQAEDVG